LARKIPFVPPIVLDMRKAPEHCPNRSTETDQCLCEN
jgi:hypothetical protein